MADFYINKLPTFSLLYGESTRPMEEKLQKAAERIPMGVLIPALYSDLSGDAMKNIIKVLSEMELIKRVYICLDRATAENYHSSLEIIKPLGEKGVLIWNDSPVMREIIAEIEKELVVDIRGKGNAVWTGLGYVIAKSEVSALAFHDADIVTYDKDFLIRLLFPIVHLRYQFSKGYYIRYNNKFYGRVCRLFYFPFVRSLKDIFGCTEYIDYMGDFRYPLSGEFAIFVNQARMLEFPSDWGIEVGILGEIYRNMRVNRICQIELTPRYDHKHQNVGETPDEGLYKMASDIARTFFAYMASNGRILGTDTVNSVRFAYIKNAREAVSMYESYADMYDSRVSYDFHEELKTVELFAKGIANAAESLYHMPRESVMLPDWKRVESAIDDIQSKLISAVENPPEV
jgi:glucosyl-3-phosphoglycerate synthase